MKINKAKLLVGTLAIASVAATVGSISGTVAWFQYSTRSTVAYSGAVAHVSENLQIKLYKVLTPAQGETPAVTAGSDEWKSDLRLADIQDYIKAVRNKEDYDLRPVTSGATLSAEGKVAHADELKKSPIYQITGAYDTWENADALDYVELPIQLRVIDREGQGADGSESEKFLAKKVFLTDLTFNSVVSGTKKDITPALRVSFEAGSGENLKAVTFSQDGEDVVTTGKLDLNGDGRDDKVKGYEDFGNLDYFIYGDADSKEVTTKKETSVPAGDNVTEKKTYIADDTDPYNLFGNELGTTPTDGTGLTVTVRIYLEGWQKLDNSDVTANAVEKDVENSEALLAAEGLVDGTIYKINGDKYYRYSAGHGQATDADYVAPSCTELDPKSAVWSDKEYVSSGFQVGMRFAVDAHKDSDHAA